MSQDSSSEPLTETEQVVNPPAAREPLEQSKPALQGMDNAQLIPVDWIQPNPHQVRTSVEEESIEELTSSIKESGVLEPLLVVRKGRKRFVLVAGHRRLAAARRAELSAVPCIVKEMGEDEFLLYSLIENLQRADLTPMEEALALKKMIDVLGLSYRDVARKIGKSHGFVGERLALLDLPEDLKAAVISRKLPLRKALDLSKIPLPRVREKLIKKGSGFDTEAFGELVEDEIARLQKKRKPYEKWDAPPELREFVKGNDSVRLSRNKITLRYESPEALLSLLAELVSVLKAYEEA